jgi:hypothetical protein
MAYVKVPIKVKEKKEANKKPNKAASQDEGASNIAAHDDLPNELNEPRWSVVTFDRCAASNLTYSEAIQELEKLHAKHIAGLCIITDEAAERIKSKTSN